VYIDIEWGKRQVHFVLEEAWVACLQRRLKVELGVFERRFEMQPFETAIRCTGMSENSRCAELEVALQR
jgi:hypothetical protein